MMAWWNGRNEGNRYLLRWMEAYSIAKIEATTVVDTIMSQWLARFGCPEHITTDQGRQFTSSTFNELCKRLNITLIRTSAYNPRGNGLIERMHRTLNAALRALNDYTRWTSKLPLILLSMRTCVKEDLKRSMAE